MALECLTRALRERRPELVREELVAMLIAGEEEWLRDERDLMVALAPYHHCAAQLQLDVPAVFDAAASAGPATVRSTVTEFGRRTDVTPEAFGFVVEWDEDGPRYGWAGPSGAETVERLRRAGILDPDDL
jgi:hypothetical protein